MPPTLFDLQEQICRHHHMGTSHIKVKKQEMMHILVDVVHFGI
jgi:hypothetical protein